MSEIELLAPAKNIECAMAAITHGADAVYIGGPSFGARAAAGNSFEDLEQLVRFAHPYHAKVFITLNTILKDNELAEAERQVMRYYEMGVDALIVQDMGLLKLDLPPIALHASTQMDNRTPEKVGFLQNAGFQRVVLARELSLQQIQEIRQACDVELEAFVHGALCVSYSGRCYMSYVSCGRSANRGECAQFCRLPYTLVDADGNTIVRDRHLLSLKDMDRSDWLLPMMQAGIMSFKIEGRLKDVSYVKNITAYYRRRIDAILEGHPEYKAASIGKTTLFFEPDPEKTFHRDKTPYFINGERTEMVQLATPKSTGTFVGTVQSVSHNSLTYSGEKELHNGDGLCFIDAQGKFDGFRVNKVEGRRVFWNEPVEGLSAGDKLYRNYDIQFEKMLAGKSSERRIALDFKLLEKNEQLVLQATDEAGTTVELPIQEDRQVADKPEQALQNLQTQLSKLGNTCYQARKIEVETSQVYFFPNSVIAGWRRQIIDMLMDTQYVVETHGCASLRDDSRKLPCVVETYQGTSLQKLPLSQLPEAVNVMNDKAKDFYQELGFGQIEDAYEKIEKPNVEAHGHASIQNSILMTCKYCIRHALGACPKEVKSNKTCGNVDTRLIASLRNEPLFLKTGRHTFQLSFDCAKCEMIITTPEGK
ncbi:MAG: U32 family peptidase [Bacteroidales bacterium]|nr:U32 family peptidase [Bacteroidales bacterium]